MADLRDKLFLHHCVAAGRFDQERARRIHDQAVLEDRRATDLMVEQGLLTRAEVEAVLRDLAGREALPRMIGGYRIVRVLGRGGMATVYLAEQAASGRQVALKLITTGTAGHDDLVDRFLREARLAASIVHPRVIRVIDLGRHAGSPFLVMELITGGDAAQLAAAAGGRLDERRALALVADCCEGLAALHALRLVHRDIKPSNMLIDGDGRAKLGDLGLARSADGHDRLTTTGMTVGTPAFMSPEQASASAALDVRSDLYALGASLYTLLTGQAPYQGETPVRVAAQIITQPFPDPLALRPDLTPAVAELIRVATARDPAQRHQTPEVLRGALRALLGGAEAPLSWPAARTQTAPAVALPPPTVLHRPPARRRPGALMVSALLLGLAAALALWWLLAR